MEGKMTGRLRDVLAGASAILGIAAIAAPGFAELPVEPTPNVKSLPADYPDSWVYLVDPNFYGLESGKIVIADVGHDWDHHKGSVGLAQFGLFAESSKRPELYVVDTFYSRGHRGERTDVLTVYDKATLNPKAEVILPGGKRAQVLTEEGAFQLSADERWAYVYNFTPASSVTVVDLASRKVASEIDIPGCAHAFSLGGNGFASLCGNGAIASTRLDANGKFQAQKMSAPFTDIDNDPMFTRPVVIGEVAYFPTYKGKLQPIDLSGGEAIVMDAFDIPAPPAAAPAPAKPKSWRDRIPGLGRAKKESAPYTGKYLPSGWQIGAQDDAGRLYLIMRPTENIDDHDTGGKEVWVIDPKAKTFVRRIDLRADSQIIEVTRGANPLLVAVMPDMSLDVFDAITGEWKRRIGGQIVMTPFAVRAGK
jgi:methylamine dehydrogenase heavy chain